VKRRRAPAGTIRQLQRALALLTTLAPPEDVVRERAETVLSHLAGIPIPILIANNGGHYVDVNTAAARLTGYTRAELLRMSVWDLTPSPRRALGLRLWRAFLERGRMTGRYELRRRDGTAVRARYFAVANVLPGVHVSALVPLARRISRVPRKK
jgi:PAS domain S-box-containing protein